MPQIRKPPTVAPAFNHYFSAYGKKFCALAIKVLRRPTLWFLFQLVGNANAKSHCSYAQWSALGPLFNPLLVHFQAATTFRGRLKFLSLFIFIKYSCTLLPSSPIPSPCVCGVCVAWRVLILFASGSGSHLNFGIEHSALRCRQVQSGIQDSGCRIQEPGFRCSSPLRTFISCFSIKNCFSLHLSWLIFNWFQLSKTPSPGQRGFRFPCTEVRWWKKEPGVAAELSWTEPNRTEAFKTAPEDKEILRARHGLWEFFALLCIPFWWVEKMGKSVFTQVGK